MANELEVIVKESGLETTKAKIILEKFKDYFDIAAEWEVKAKSIIVTKIDQKAEMKMAKVGKSFIQSKIKEIEDTRKALKEQALREGKAIDGIANVLKGLLVPIKEYLDNQANYEENLIKAKELELRLEAEKKVEEERIAKEKAEAEERERIKLENIKLKEEAEKKEKELQAERKKVEAERQAELKKIEEKARVEREKQAKILAEQKAKAETERKLVEEKARKEKEASLKKLELEQKEKERLAEILKNTIECPACHHKFLLKK